MGHEESFRGLGGVVHRDQLITLAAQAFAGDAQPSDVEHLQLVPQFPVRRTGLFQLGAQRVELVDERGRQAPGDQSRRCLQQARRGGLDRPLLEERLNGAAGDGFLSEQVGSAHNQSHLYATGSQWACHSRNHGGRTFVVDTTGEEHLQLRRRHGRVVGQEVVDDLQLRFPQGEAGPGTDVATAFGAFENELACARSEVLAQQGRRRHVQERADARFLELFRQRRPSTGDDRARRFGLEDEPCLRVPQFVRREAEQSRAPRPIAKGSSRLRQHLLRLSRAGKGKRDERQATLISDSDASSHCE